MRSDAAAPPECPPTGALGRADLRTITVVVAIQLAISLGYFAVMAHVVAHLRDDLGLLAGTVTLLLAVRVAAQNMLFLPTGALTDAIGPARAGALACTLRAASFALLGVADGLAGLLTAVILMAVGGALFHPAAQSVLAGVSPPHRARGFAAYVIAGQFGAVAGPPIGLALLTAGFGTLSAAATTAWTAGAALFLLLHRKPTPNTPRIPPETAPVRRGAGRPRRRPRPNVRHISQEIGAARPGAALSRRHHRPDVRHVSPGVRAARRGMGQFRRGPQPDVRDNSPETGAVRRGAGRFRRRTRPDVRRISSEIGAVRREAGTFRRRRRRPGARGLSCGIGAVRRGAGTFRRRRGPGARRLSYGIGAVLRDRVFVRFAVAAAPTTLLTTQVSTVVPLREPDAGLTTLFFCVVALSAAAVQPWCGGRERPALLRIGLLCAAAGYLVLLPADGPAALVLAGALHGAATGLTQSALFRTVTGAAPQHRFGVYFGLLSFLAGVFSLAGGLVVGPLLERPPHGPSAALLTLALLATLTATAVTRAHPPTHRPPNNGPEHTRPAKARPS